MLKEKYSINIQVVDEEDHENEHDDDNEEAKYYDSEENHK